MHLIGRRRTKYVSYAKTAVIAALFLAVAIPFTKKMTTGAVTYTPDERYMVVLNGEKLGYVSDEEIADTALVEARSRMNVESSGLSLVEADVEVYTEKAGGAVLSQDELADSMYTALSADAVTTESEKEAYTVRIDDFTVTLASKDDVAALLEKVKDKYSESNEFTVELVEDNSGLYSSLKTNFVSADVKVNEAAKVLASADGNAKADESAKNDVVYTDGVLSVDFAENIEIIPTKASDANVVSIDEAYELITKEHAEKGTYTVSAGDSLYGIAESHGLTLDELFALNYGIDINTTIYDGDLITVTVPASEISVVVVEEKSYDESYSADVEYVDNDTLSRLLASDEAMDALMRIEGFRSLNADIETIINKSNAVKKAKKEGEKLTPKEKKELTEAEKEYKSKRKMIQEKLIKFATRVPVFMYLTDYREYSLQDVITQLEPDLFKKVTGLDVKDFELLVSLNVFNEALMNDAVYKFKRYEDASLIYTGIDKHTGENVGLYSTVISREDYDAMAGQLAD